MDKSVAVTALFWLFVFGCLGVLAGLVVVWFRRRAGAMLLAGGVLALGAAWLIGRIFGV